jgi:PPK2 family polyphosphate:nucleotide phosphotransferase
VPLHRVIARARTLAARYRVAKGKGFRIHDVKPTDTGGLSGADKAKIQSALEEGTAAMSEMQNRLYAEGTRALLVVFQAMDAAGKDSAIKHVMSGVNPQGCQVHAFKAPGGEELGRDFLWRAHVNVPVRGHIGIFNRSHYEEVLTVRLHPEWLDRQRLPPSARHGEIWRDRLRDIRAFERYLAAQGISVLKFFLHVSRAEQKRRLLERIDTPAKQYKFSAQDVRERALWNSYMRVYEEAIRETATESSPWFVVPADNKWFTRAVVSAAITSALADLDPHYPRIAPAERRELARVRRALLSK